MKGNKSMDLKTKFTDSLLGCCNTNTVLYVSFQEEHRARLKAEKIRIALEKIKEAKIKKVCGQSFYRMPR